MNDNNLPNVEEKYLELTIGELVVLKPEYDDHNFRRIYKIASREKNLISVEVISENPINLEEYKNTEGNEKHETSVGKTFNGMKAEFFEPFM